jgi:hypothetical protein
MVPARARAGPGQAPGRGLLLGSAVPPEASRVLADEGCHGEGAIFMLDGDRTGGHGGEGSGPDTTGDG